MYALNHVLLEACNRQISHYNLYSRFALKVVSALTVT